MTAAGLLIDSHLPQTLWHQPTKRRSGIDDPLNLIVRQIGKSGFLSGLLVREGSNRLALLEQGIAFPGNRLLALGSNRQRLGVVLSLLTQTVGLVLKVLVVGGNLGRQSLVLNRVCFAIGFHALQFALGLSHLFFNLGNLTKKSVGLLLTHGGKTVGLDVGVFLSLGCGQHSVRATHLKGCWSGSLLERALADVWPTGEGRSLARYSHIDTSPFSYREAFLSRRTLG